MSRVVGPMHELNRKASRPSGEELPTEATGRSVSKHVILAGVPIGAAVGSLIPKDLLSYGSVAFASILAVLSLVALRRHVVAFGLRCGCAALVLVLAGQSATNATERAANVILGGVIGVSFMLITRIALILVMPSSSVAETTAQRLT
jgi:hypothetical protein